MVSTAAWRPYHRSPMTGATDAAALAWNPDSSCLAVWDSPLSYRVLLYGRDGSPKASFCAYEDALGVVGGSWGPSGQLLAVGSCDQVCKGNNWVIQGGG